MTATRHVRVLVTLGSPVLPRSGWAQGLSGAVDRATHLPKAASRLPRAWSEQGSLRVPATSVHSRSDGIVTSSLCRYGAGPRREDVEVRGSHLGLGHNPAVLWLLADRLAQPEASWAPFRPPRRLRALFPR
ncbi:MAG: putative hydrolase [Frankiales bacterium]|nr:putative hydrolase [Frankiales bacterium]